jgi:hypothetical protein
VYCERHIFGGVCCIGGGAAACCAKAIPVAIAIRKAPTPNDFIDHSIEASVETTAIETSHRQAPLPQAAPAGGSSFPHTTHYYYCSIAENTNGSISPGRIIAATNMQLDCDIFVEYRSHTMI